jgi:HIT zinc finger
MAPPPTNGRRTVACEVAECSALSRYECPRCALAYCSVACYKHHSDACVDAFHRDTAENLRDVRATKEERKRMNEILQRLLAADGEGPDGRERPDLDDLSDDGDDDSDADDLDHLLDDVDGRSDLSSKYDYMSPTLFMSSSSSSRALESGSSLPVSPSRSSPRSEDSGLDCDDDGDRKCDDDAQQGRSDGDVGNADADALEELLDDMNNMGLSYEDALKRLPQALAVDFCERVGDGRIGRLVKLWRPWWLASVCECEDDASNSESDEDEGDDGLVIGDLRGTTAPLPPAQTDLPLSPTSARAVASPALLYSVVDVVASYCLAMRLCNGDWESSASATASLMWKNSGVLSNDARHSSAAEAVVSLLARGGPDVADAATEAVADCAAVLRWGGAVAAGGVDGGTARALREVCAVIRVGAGGKGRTTKAERKAGFLCAWACGATSTELLQAASDTDAWVVARRERTKLASEAKSYSPAQTLTTATARRIEVRTADLSGGDFQH